MATTFTNQATLSYNGNTVRSNVAVGAVEGALSVDKQASAASYSAGDTLTYVVSAVNSGSSDASGLTVTDNLGAYAFADGAAQPLSYVEGSLLYYVNGVLQPAPQITVSETDGLSISGVTIPAGGNAMFVYSAVANSFSPPDAGSEIINTVAVTGDSVCGVTAENTLPVAAGASLSLLKSVSPIPVAENGELTYTFLMQNFGNTAVTAADNAVVSDTFAPALTDIAVSLNGVPLEADTDYSYDETAGVFATADGVLTMPAAGSSQNPDTGEWSVMPASAELTVTGRIGTICDIIEP